MDLMTDGKWVTGQSHADIALAHGVSPVTVKAWATTASRVIRLAIEEDLENIRARMVATLESITKDARVDREHRAAVASVETAAKLLGLVVTKNEITVSPEEADKLIAEAARLAAAK